MDVAAARAEAWLAHQRKRFMRPDAGRYMHPDAARGMRPQADISPRHAVIEAQKDFSPIEAERRALLAAKALAAELKFYLALRRCSRKYRDDQPRDDHGRWVYDGGRRRAGAGGRVLIADASDVVASPVMSDASPDPIIPGAHYAQTKITVHPSALTGLSTIDNTTIHLTDTLAGVMDLVDYAPGLTPQVYGTAVHTAFGAAVRAQRLPGIAFSDVETTFGGSRYGAKDSIRTDVILRNEVGDIIAIYDVKTGSRGIDPGRAAELRSKTGVGAGVPIIEMHISRGVSRKAFVGVVGFVDVKTPRR